MVLIGSVVFVLEYKIGEDHFAPYKIDQVVDYALDLKNFHESSHDRYIAPQQRERQRRASASL